MEYKQELWDEAKRKCHIGDEEIRIVKEMGLNPKSLIKNIPGRNVLMPLGRVQSNPAFYFCKVFGHCDVCCH